MDSELTVNILLVDDQPANLLALEAALRGVEANLVRACSGREALRYALHTDFAVILLDVQMPDISGFETARLIRERERSRHTPIIFVTAGGTSPLDVQRGYSLGAVDYLAKPFDPAVLRAKVKALVRVARQAEAATRLSQAHYVAILQSALDAIITIDDAGNVVEWNPAAERIFGWPRPAVLGKELAELILPPEAREAHRAGLARCNETGEGPVLGQRLELTALRVDGSVLPVELTVTRIALDGPPLYTGYVRDISERKQAEAEVAAAARQQAAVSRLGQQALAGGDLSALMHAAVRLVADTLQVTHCSLLELMPADDRFEVRAAVGWEAGPPAQLQIPNGTGSLAGYSLLIEEPLIVPDMRVETRFARTQTLRDHEIISALSVIVPGEEQPFGALGVYSTHQRAFTADDIHFVQAVANVLAEAIQRARLEEELRRRAEDLAEADRRKDAFLMMLAHELRNPVGAISNATYVLNQLGSPVEQVVQLQATISRQTRHLGSLVDDLLDVSRIVQGRIELRREPVDLALLVREAAKDYQGGVQAAGLSFALDAPDEPLCVLGDRTRLLQVVGNLLQNAAKFTDAPGEVRLCLSEDPDGSATLAVRDTGIGIPADLLPYLFEPFMQADRTLDRSRGGLGLGLALVKGLAEQHGGSVTVQSAGVGRGAEFVVRLPLYTGAAATVHPTAAPAPASGPLRVLVVEDIRDAAETLRDLLELFGHTVELAFSGPAGVEAAQRFRPDVVLCDIGLPGLDGYGVAAALRSDPKTASMRLIAVSGYGSDEDLRRSHEVGFDHHLVKPVDPTALERLLTAGA